MFHVEHQPDRDAPCQPAAGDTDPKHARIGRPDSACATAVPGPAQHINEGPAAIHATVAWRSRLYKLQQDVALRNGAPPSTPPATLPGLSSPVPLSPWPDRRSVPVRLGRDRALRHP